MVSDCAVKRRVFWSTIPVGTTSSPVSGTPLFPGRLYLWLGIGLVLLGPILYMIQLWAKLLRPPWYGPAFTTAGVALVLLALRRRRTVWRGAVLALCGLLAVAEWYFLLSLSKLPAYTGPSSAGSSFPIFSTTLADGSAFNQDSLRGRQNTALVFFRGRW
jgi:hypothetical protein